MHTRYLPIPIYPGESTTIAGASPPHGDSDSDSDLLNRRLPYRQDQGVSARHCRIISLPTPEPKALSPGPTNQLHPTHVGTSSSVQPTNHATSFKVRSSELTRWITMVSLTLGWDSNVRTLTKRKMAISLTGANGNLTLRRRQKQWHGK